MVLEIAKQVSVLATLHALCHIGGDFFCSKSTARWEYLNYVTRELPTVEDVLLHCIA